MSNESVTEIVLKEGQAEGWAEGRIRGQTELIERMVMLKFGPKAAFELLDYLQQVVEPERMAEISEWLVEHQSDEDLLERMGPRPWGIPSDRGFPSDWKEQLLERWVEGEASSRERGRAKGLPQAELRR